MRITRNQLRRIIKEELSSLSEQRSPGAFETEEDTADWELILDRALDRGQGPIRLAVEAILDGRKLISLGDEGDVVEYLQRLLLGVGEELPRYGVDGVFGSETEDAVESFQIKHGLKPDAIVGKMTIRELLMTAVGTGVRQALEEPGIASPLIESIVEWVTAGVEWLKRNQPTHLLKPEGSYWTVIQRSPGQYQAVKSSMRGWSGMAYKLAIDFQEEITLGDFLREAFTSTGPAIDILIAIGSAESGMAGVPPEMSQIMARWEQRFAQAADDAERTGSPLEDPGLLEMANEIMALLEPAVSGIE